MSDIEVDVDYAGFGEPDSKSLIFYIDNPSEITIQNHELKSYNDYVYFIPARPGMNNYEFWLIKGEHKQKKFFIIGYTNEVAGDTWLERNGLVIDLTKLLFIGGMITIIILKLLNNRKQKNIS